MPLPSPPTIPNQPFEGYTQPIIYASNIKEVNANVGEKKSLFSYHNIK